MMIYLACGLVPLGIGLALPQVNRQERWKIGYLVCVFAVLALVLGLRGEGVGIDTEAYTRYYGYLADRDDFMSIINSAPIYSIVSKLLYFVCTDAQVVLMAEAVVTCAAIAYFIYVFSPRVEISSFLFVALYFYENAFNGARQMCAAALCLAALALVQRRHLVAAVIAVVCALGVHVTCMVMVPFIVLAWWRGTSCRSAHLAVALVVLVAVAAIALRPLLQIVTHLLPGYQQYLALLDDPEYVTRGRNVLMGLFFLALGLMECWLMRSGGVRARGAEMDAASEDPAVHAISLAALFGGLWSVAFFWNAFLGPRLAWFPTSVLIGVIPDLLRRLKYTLRVEASGGDASGKTVSAIVVWLGGRVSLAKMYRVFCALVLLACLVLQVIQLVGNYSGVVPYYPFWMD